MLIEHMIDETVNFFISIGANWAFDFRSFCVMNRFLMVVEVHKIPDFGIASFAFLVHHVTPPIRVEMI